MGRLKKDKTKNITDFHLDNLMKVIAGVDEVGRGSLMGPVLRCRSYFKKIN